MNTVVNMKDYSGGIDEAISFYHDRWGTDKNYPFFQDAIRHSTNEKNGLPRFYLLLEHENIIGCCGLIVNDFISRHDLLPWLCGLFIIKSRRGRNLGNSLMAHAETEARTAGYTKLHLATDLNGYYEKFGWQRIEDGYYFWGEATKIYTKTL